MNKMGTDRMLLHACCGPCSILVWQQLLKEFDDVTPFFYNPNIENYDEYKKRFFAMETVSNRIGLPFLHDHTGLKEWKKTTQRFANEPEGGLRCFECIKFRLEKTFSTATTLKYQMVTTTLTVSRHKNSAMIFEIGKTLEDQYKISFLPKDFKKQNGSQLSNIMARKWDIYRQTYCGCSYTQKP